MDQFIVDILKARKNLGMSLAKTQGEIEMFYDRDVWNMDQIDTARLAARGLLETVKKTAKYIADLMNKAKKSDISEGVEARMGLAYDQLFLSAQAIEELLTLGKIYIGSDRVADKRAYAGMFKFYFGGEIGEGEERRVGFAWRYARSAWSMLFYATQGDKNVKMALDAKDSSMYYDARKMKQEIWSFDTTGLIIYGERTLGEKSGKFISFSPEQITSVMNMLKNKPDMNLTELAGYFGAQPVPVPRGVDPGIKEYTHADEIEELARIKASDAGKFVELYDNQGRLLYVARPDERKVHEIFAAGLRSHAARPWGAETVGMAEPALVLSRPLTATEKRYVTEQILPKFPNASTLDVVNLINSSDLYVTKSGKRYKGKEFEVEEETSKLWQFYRDEERSETSNRNLVISRTKTFNRKLSDQELRLVKKLLKEDPSASIEKIASENLALDVVPLASVGSKRELAARFGDPQPMTVAQPFHFERPGHVVMAQNPSDAKKELELFEYIWSARF